MATWINRPAWFTTSDEEYEREMQARLAEQRERAALIRAARSNAARRGAATRKRNARRVVDMTPGADPPRCDYGHCTEYATQTVDNRGRERRPMCGRHADLVIRLDSGNTIR